MNAQKNTDVRRRAGAHRIGSRDAGPVHESVTQTRPMRRLPDRPRMSTHIRMAIFLGIGIDLGLTGLLGAIFAYGSADAPSVTPQVPHVAPAVLLPSPTKPPAASVSYTATSLPPYTLTAPPTASVRPSATRTTHSAPPPTPKSSPPTPTVTVKPPAPSPSPSDESSS